MNNRSCFRLCTCLMLCVMGLSAMNLQAQEKPASDEKPKKKKSFNDFVHPNAKMGYVEVDGRICLSDGMLELFATTPKGKTHEAIVELKVPSKLIHFHLILLGAKSGSPGYFKFDENNKPQPVAATGDEIEVTLIYTPKGTDKPVTLKISDLIIDENGKPFSDRPFLFSGSRITKTDAGVHVYEADNGNAVSLVSFGDEMLAYQTPASHRNTDLIWTINKKKIPPLNTKVRVRFQVVKAKKAPATQPAETKSGS